MPFAHLTPGRLRARALRAVAAAVALAAVACPSASASTAPPSANLAEAPVTITPAAPIEGSAQAARAPQALTPSKIHAVYALPERGARGQRIAIISAYDDPHLQADLNAYDKRFGLPPCTFQNRCLGKLNERGKPSPLPGPDATGGMWITESALGTEVAHAVCQSCSIVLVEADQDSPPDLSKAVGAAAQAGATVVVTTFTPAEDPLASEFEHYYSDPHAAVVSAVGDAPGGYQWGYSGELNFPSSLPDVLAVGGTQLRTGRGSGETAWSGTVSGCSLYFHPAPWQTNAATKSACGSQRAGADVAALASPGAVVHITGAGQPGGPWYLASGTSLSSPIIGGVIGLAGSMGSREAQILYQRAHSDPSAFHDITTGANAADCPGLICKAVRGWDGPTGLGTPAGLEAFLPGGPKLALHDPRITPSAPRDVLRPSKNWVTRVHLSNGNAFRVSGSLVVERSLRIGGRLRLIRFATANFRLGPLGTASPTLRIAKQYRSLLKSLGSVTVSARLVARGAVGPAATVQRKLTLHAP